MSGLAVYLIWFLAPHTTLYGIPTADTFRVLADRLGDGVHELRTAVVPAPATDGAIVLSVLVVWVMAATADALAFWRRATIGAVAPALARVRMGVDARDRLAGDPDHRRLPRRGAVVPAGAAPVARRTGPDVVLRPAGAGRRDG